MNWMSSFCERIVAFSGGVLFTQFPSFFSQYLHELSGHLSEGRHQVDALNDLAKTSGKTLPELIAKFHGSNDIDFIRQGDYLQSVLDRWNFLNESYQALQHSSLLTKPFLFLKYLNKQILEETYAQFAWGINFTTEGIFYALLGIFFGFAVFRLVYEAFALLFKKREISTNSPQF